MSNTAVHLPDLMTPIQAAAYLGFSIRTLKKWRLKHQGPAPVRIGQSTVRYRKETVDAWLAARESASAA